MVTACSLGVHMRLAYEWSLHVAGLRKAARMQVRPAWWLVYHRLEGRHGRPMTSCGVEEEGDSSSSQSDLRAARMMACHDERYDGMLVWWTEMVEGHASRKWAERGANRRA